jgi:hypothetical protein
MAIVVKSDDGKRIMILDNGFSASLKDGIWVNKALYDAYELDQHFSDVEDVAEVKALMAQAREALSGKRHLATA